MAVEYDILDRHKGEAVEILLAAKAPGGTEVIREPASQTVSITVSGTPGGESILSFNGSPQVLMTDAATGEWLITLRVEDIEPLMERKTYYYNIWSQFGTATPRLQAKGKIRLDRSISV